MTTLINDIRYAVRRLCRSPVFTLVAVLTLALGTGANVAIFGFIRGVLLRPVPLPDAERLVQIRETRKPGSRYASMRQCRQEIDAAESLFRMEGIPVFHTTHSSIEEISSRVMLQLDLQREMF